MRKYELVVLLKPGLAQEDIDIITKKISGIIEAVGGKSVSSSPLGKKALSYPISKFSEAFYIQFNFELEAVCIKEVEAKLKLEENVIRHLLLRSDL